MAERSIARVPRLVLALLALGLAAQIALKASSPQPRAKAEDLAPAPSIAALRLASFGDPVALAKALMLYLQAFDYQSGSKVPYHDLDYGRLEAWLARILELDPRGQYPLLAASRLYAEVPVEEKQRRMLEFVYRQFFVDPNRRWPWLAHAAAIAKHRLRDLPLARRYAAAIQRHAGTSRAERSRIRPSSGSWTNASSSSRPGLGSRESLNDCQKLVASVHNPTVFVLLDAKMRAPAAISRVYFLRNS